MQACPNAWADTAFTPIDDIMQMVYAGLIDRMMWGTDLPMMYVYAAHSTNVTMYDFKGYYDALLSQLHNSLNNTADYYKLTYQTASLFYRERYI